MRNLSRSFPFATLSFPNITVHTHTHTHTHSHLNEYSIGRKRSSPQDTTIVGMEQRTRSNSKRTSPPQPPPLRTSLYSAPGGGRSPLSAPPQAPHEGKGLFGDGGAHPPQASSSFPQQQSGRFQPNLFGKQQRTIYFTLTEAAAAAAGGATGGRGVQRAASASASATHANARGGGVIARHQSDNASTSTYTTTSEGEQQQQQEEGKYKQQFANEQQHHFVYNE